MNGVSHPEYNKAVQRELNDFLKRQNPRITKNAMTQAHAVEFLNRIKNSSNSTIRAFNIGVADEAARALTIGAKVYQQNVGALGSTRAHELAREAGGQAAKLRRTRLNALASAGRRGVTRAGSIVLRKIPVANGVIAFWTLDTRSALNEIALDLSGPIGFGRDAGVLLSHATAAMIESGQVTQAQIQAHYGASTFGSAAANQAAIEHFERTNSLSWQAQFSRKVNPWLPHNWSFNFSFNFSIGF